MSLHCYFKPPLPYPKGSLSLNILSAVIASVNKEVMQLSSVSDIETAELCPVNLGMIAPEKLSAKSLVKITEYIAIICDLGLPKLAYLIQ